MAKTLVIVESPAKARTIERFLKSGYEVLASYGHVRDLPESADEIPDEIRKKKWGRIGVDTEGNFKPYYVIPNDKRKYVQALRSALKGANQVLLATDPDREGESISWHLKEILKPKVPVKRIVFHEITKDAINEALKDAHDVDENLVRAQESRRILDRLYGYTISPVLWKKVQTGLSAGRVQSVATRLIVDREEERLKFTAATYWDLEARLSGDGREFTASLARVGNERVATGKDFDEKGVLTGKNARVLSEADGRGLMDALWAHLPWTVTAVDEKPGVERASAAFHDVHAHAGSEPQARVLHRAHHASRAAALSGRAHLVSPDRFDDAERKGARRLGGDDSRHVRRRVLLGAAPLCDESEERPGGARGDSARRFRRDAGVPGIGVGSKRPPRLRTDLEADDGVADGRRAGPAHERGNLRRRRQR
jgi:hypothetical protein